MSFNVFKLLLLLNPAAQAQVGKTKLFINCFHKHMRQGKLKKTQLGEAHLFIYPIYLVAFTKTIIKKI